MMIKLTHCLAPALLLLASQAFGQAVPTPKVDVTDTYHGVTVHDPYRWLEDAADPKVAAWTAAQNEHTRAYLDARPECEPASARGLPR